MNKNGIFITGTDTGVGKTIVAAVLTRLIRDRGVNVAVMKPVTSGCIWVNGQLVSEDARLLTWAAGCDATNPDIAPYLLETPIAPSEAASRENVWIDLDQIREAYLRLASRHDFVIVEGAGGLMVPLCGGLLIADLIKLLDLPILVVARPALGTINHALLTCFAAQQMKIETRGVIINNYPEVPDITEEYAPHLLDSLSGAPLLGVFSHQNSDNDQTVVERIVARLKDDPTTNLLLREVGID